MFANPGAGGISAPADFGTGKYGFHRLGLGSPSDSPASGQVFDDDALRTSGTNVAPTERAEARIRVSTELRSRVCTDV
jgi:hypothetical protein